VLDIIFLHLGPEYKYLQPIKEHKLLRLGGISDGGYIVPEKLIHSCDHLLSFGMGDDWLFEEEFSQLKTASQINVYDASVPNQRFNLQKLKDYEIFFKGQRQHYKEMVGQIPGYTSFVQTFERMPNGNILIKMDIEGDEYQSIEHLLHYQDRIPGMVIEFHLVWAEYPRFKKTIQMIQQFYQIVHLHGNNYGKLSESMLPDVLEISFMRSELCESTQKRCLSYISNLDSPNNASKSDWCLLFDI